MSLLSAALMEALQRLQPRPAVPAFAGAYYDAASLGCRSSCSGDCDDSCSGSCEDSCAGSCQDSCSGSCEYSASWEED